MHHHCLCCALIKVTADLPAASLAGMALNHLSSRLQPGVASVYCSIVQQTKNGVEFYIKHFPEVAGRPYADARWVPLEASGLADMTCLLRWPIKQVM